MGTVPYEVWAESAIAHLEVGDEAGYRRVCGVMRGRHPATIPDWLIRARLADVLTLGPGGLGDDGKGLGWIETVPAAVRSEREDVRRWVLMEHGAVRLRAGRSAEAIGRIRESIATGDGEVAFEEAVFLAMAYFHAADHAYARSSLGGLGDGGPNGPSSREWWDARARGLLRREAVRLILDPDFPADSFAR